MNPNMQIQYNKYMDSVDHFNHYYLTFAFSWKTVKWFQVIWHSIVEVILVYECVAYNLEIPGEGTCPQEIPGSFNLQTLVTGFERRIAETDVRFPLFVDLRLTV
jgi:hypothetical protein